MRPPCRLDRTFAPVERPTGNAVAERFVLTMKTGSSRPATGTRLTNYGTRSPAGSRSTTTTVRITRSAWKTPTEKRAENLNQHMSMAA